MGGGTDVQPIDRSAQGEHVVGAAVEGDATTVDETALAVAIDDVRGGGDEKALGRLLDASGETLVRRGGDRTPAVGAEERVQARVVVRHVQDQYVLVDP